MISQSQNKPRVLVSVPNGDGWIHKHVVFTLMRMQLDNRVASTFILPTHKPYENNLHKIKNDLLKGDYDFWINIDSDNPPRQNVFDLVFLNKDIIGCPTPVWANMKEGDYPIYWNALDQVDGGFKPHLITEGLQRVDAIGSGCFVIARRVMAKMNLCYPFARTWNDDGTVEMGGDYTFCCKARKLNFEVYAHYGYPCYHFNEIEIGEVQQAFEAVIKSGQRN